MFAAVERSSDIWRYQAHVEVWVLVAGLVLSYVYLVKVVGPRAVPDGQKPVRRGQIAAFVGAVALMWLVSDWPIHDLSEEYLYSAHMFQHMVYSYFVPPLVWFATPEWLMRLLVGNGRLYRAVRTLARPVVAGVLFNLMVIVTHIPGVVNTSVSNGAVHYAVHVLVVTTGLLMWLPLLGPLPELRMSPGTSMVYLFLMSIVPTVPAAWLTLADGAVYSAYDHDVRPWGLSVTSDQQIAGLIMKVGGSIFLWSVIAVMFFRRFMANWEAEQERPTRPAESHDVVGGDGQQPLTMTEVLEAFERVPPVAESSRSTGD